MWLLRLSSNLHTSCCQSYTEENFLFNPPPTRFPSTSPPLSYPLGNFPFFCCFFLILKNCPDPSFHIRPRRLSPFFFHSYPPTPSLIIIRQDTPPKEQEQGECAKLICAPHTAAFTYMCRCANILFLNSQRIFRFRNLSV